MSRPWPHCATFRMIPAKFTRAMPLQRTQFNIRTPHCQGSRRKGKQSQEEKWTTKSYLIWFLKIWALGCLSHFVSSSFLHTTVAGVKKSGGFSPEKRSLVRALRVRLYSPTPPDGEGLGPLWFAPKTTEIWVREKIESYGKKPAKKQVSWNDLCLG